MPLSIKPAHGTLEASIFENPELGLRRQMFFSIAIPVTVPFGGESVATEIRLDFIRIATESLEDMEGKTYWFPVNPSAGYIDGSLYLGHAHNPFDCTRLAFGEAAKGSLPVELEYEIDFGHEGPEELGIVNGTLKTTLAFDRESLIPIMAEGILLG